MENNIMMFLLENFNNTTSCTWPREPFRDTQVTIQRLVTALSILTMLCDVVVFFMFLRKVPGINADGRVRFVVTCIICVAIADFINSISHILGLWTLYHEAIANIHLHHNCSAQAFLTVLATIVTFIWVTVFLLGSLFDAVANFVIKNHATMFITQAVCWGIPIVTVLFLAGFGLLGEQEVDVGWCFVSTNNLSKASKILTLLFSIHLCIYVTTSISSLVFALSFCKWITQKLNLCREVKVYFDPMPCAAIRRKWPNSTLGKCHCKSSKQVQNVLLGFLVAATFFALRIPNAVIDWLVIEGNYDIDQHCKTYLDFLILASIGDSLFGTLNLLWLVIYYCLFSTPDNNHAEEQTANGNVNTV